MLKDEIKSVQISKQLKLQKQQASGKKKPYFMQKKKIQMRAKNVMPSLSQTKLIASDAITHRS
jgi:hypothetical protein